MTWDGNLSVGAARESLLVHQVQLQVLIEIREGAVAGADREGDPGELVLVDETEPGHRLGEVRPAVDEDRAVIVTSLQVGDGGAEVAAEDLGRAQYALSKLFEKTALGFSFMEVATGPSEACQCGPMIS